jgi:hypothetical protein
MKELKLPIYIRRNGKVGGVIGLPLDLPMQVSVSMFQVPLYVPVGTGTTVQ